MNPLMVAGGFGELIDPLLRDLQPVSNRDLLTYQRLQLLNVGLFPSWQRSTSLSAKCPQRRIVQMRNRVKRVERKPLAAEYKFGQRAVAYPPVYFQTGAV